MYLKKAEFNREPLYAKFRLREPFKRPILSSEPSISEHQLQPHDQFIIFASDGLWEHLSNQEAVDIVQNHPRSVRRISLVAKMHLSYYSAEKKCIFILKSNMNVCFTKKKVKKHECVQYPK